MVCHKLVASVLLVASALVQASPTAPRDNANFESGFLDTLNAGGATVLCNLMKNFFQTDAGSKYLQTLQYGKFTILAPDNDVRHLISRVASVFGGMFCSPSLSDQHVYPVIRS